MAAPPPSAAHDAVEATGWQLRSCIVALLGELDASQRAAVGAVIASASGGGGVAEVMAGGPVLPSLAHGGSAGGIDGGGAGEGALDEVSRAFLEALSVLMHGAGLLQCAVFATESAMALLLGA